MNPSAAASRPRVVIFTDQPGWHGRTLVRQLAERGYDAGYASLAECQIDLSAAAPRVVIPGVDGLPAGAFVRGVAGGTLEEVILRLDVLHALDLLGVAVYNRGRAIERTVDKALTSFLLRLRGIPTPATWVLEQRDAAAAVAHSVFARGGTLVAKPLFGSQGEGLQRVTCAEDLAALQPHQGVFYLQEFVERPSPPFRDFRVLVVDGRARFAMSRTSAHWITNRAQGAECAAEPLDRTMAELAEAACRAVRADYAGVDLLRDGAGRWWVGEVNGVPAWWGLQQACGRGVGRAIVDGFCAAIERCRAQA